MASLVNRATSDMLSGPDWAMNMELCDIIHNDPGIAKDVIKAVKKRIGHKNPGVQLLALTVLETLIKNCGEIVHYQVTAKDVLQEMVKIAKKNKNMQVRDKILLLLDTWQETFGGPNGRYPQYFFAYDEMRRSGAIFPRKIENATPMFTPPQTHPIAMNFHSPPRSPRRIPGGGQASRASDVAVLSLSDIHNARSGMEVLAEMLSAIDPQNKQALKDEVIMELVEQCYTAEKRVVQLVNTTSDEELLRQGLSLNDDLKKVLAKHDAIASGAPLPQEPAPAPKPPFAPSSVDHETQEDSDDVLSQLSRRSTSKTKASSSTPGSTILALPAPAKPEPQSKVGPPALTRAPTIDLLSGDSYATTSESTAAVTTPTVDNLALTLSGLSMQGGSYPLSNGAGLQSAPSRPSFYGNLQNGQNNLLPGTVHPHSQGSGGFSQMQGLVNNSYIVPWARPDSSPFQHSAAEQIAPQPGGSSQLSPRQAALIYGTNQPSGLVSPQQQFPSQQFAVPQFPSFYGTHVPNMAQPPSPQGYGSLFQAQQPMYMSHAHAEQNSGLGSHAYHVAAQQPQQSFNPLVNSHLPPAPWSTESALSPEATQQGTSYYGNVMAPSFVENSGQQQLFQQQQQQQPQFPGQYPTFAQSNAGNSMQLRNSYYPSVQTPPSYMQQPTYEMFQNHIVPQKETRKEDALFKDLVDFAKTKKGASGK